MLQKITNSNIIIDLKYATNENFVKQKLYDNADCYLHETAAFNIYKAALIAKNLNYKLKIYDAYRPINIQQKLWDKFQDPKYVSDPKNGELTHCRGIAVDLTLTDLNGNEADMGTDFDDFTQKAHHGSQDISDNAKKNRVILAGIMSLAGFEFLATEWWHYQLKNHHLYPII